MIQIRERVCPYVAVDFETYYDNEVSVVIQGNPVYAAHPRTAPYMVAVYSDDIEFVGHPREFDWGRIDGREWLAHNAAFDSEVFKRTQTEGWDRGATPTCWRDTADLAAWLSCRRSLDAASAALLGVKVDKSVRTRMKGRVFDDLSPDEQKEWLDYGMDDARYCFQIWDKFHHEWPEFEQTLSEHNRVRSNYGVMVDQDMIRQGINILGEVCVQARRDIPWVAEGKKLLSLPEFAKACRSAGVEPPASTADGNEDCDAWLAQYGKQLPFLRAMKDFRKANRTLQLFQTMLQRITPDGRMPYSLKYFGGHTGRYSGDGGFNMQNQARDPLYVSSEYRLVDAPEKSEWSVYLRNCITATNNSLTIGDSSQIEARLTAYLAGDWDFLDLCAQGQSPYEAHARATMGYTDPEPLKKTDLEQYQLAKARVLGLGFGCGWQKFIDVAWIMAGLRVAGRDARRIVKEYRADNPLILALWKRLDTAFRDSARDGDFQMVLPSGRTMDYFDVSTYHGGSASIYRDGSRRTKFYGGKLTENAVQAVARDVFVEAMMRLETAGLPVVFHSHDKAVIDHDEADPREVEQIMSVNPDWLPNVPLAAEADRTYRYKK